MTAKSTMRGGLWFLLAVLLLYGIAFLLDPTSTNLALDRSAELFSRLLPVLGFVISVLFIASLLLQPSWVRENLGERSGPRGWVLAVAGGILSAGPVYPWYAMLGDLRSKGMRTALMSVFLYNRAIKLPLLPLLIHYFGPTYALILFVYLILFSLPAGLLLERLIDGRPAPHRGNKPPPARSGD